MEQARHWLQQILSRMGIEAEVKVVEEQLEIEAGSLTELQKAYLLGSPPPTGSFRPGGEPGSTGIPLDALQYLANTLLNLNQLPSLQRSYTIELDGYRRRRQRELQDLALGAVERVRSSGSEYEFKALSAAERRLLHGFFDEPEYADLECFSRGKEPDRRLVLRPLPPPEPAGELANEPSQVESVESEIIP